MPTPYYEADGVTLHHGNSLDILPTLSQASIDAIVVDPPYEIGIASRDWDRTGIAFNVDLWSECLRVLKPGGHLLSFGHVRTHHRLAVAIEDAGFHIRDCIDWIYGQGYPGSKTQLKPAREPITVARAPFTGTERALRETTGLGGLNVEACRTDTGRWPANVLLGHSPLCTDSACITECPISELDRQSGIRTSGTGAVRTKPGHFMGNGGLGRAGDVQVTYGDTGGASRYFPIFRFESRITTRNDGERHITPKPLSLMRWLVRLVCPPGGTVLDWAAGSGTTLLAARDEGMNAVGIEMDEAHARICEHRLGEPFSPSLFSDIA
ncbi:hypothetical protein GCM10018777_56540 [Streptomyces albogriseolus]|uniref:DNA-methyltransferase n=1 Tax=Streptomyces TaxID=1883 RepID=UPI001673D94B|nr:MULTISPECIES: site-specific DNA-methyltransferase [Streptomyces]GHB14689.1 hypothetical protein GCM10010330_80470 [Streptomyces tendae]GHG33162.1 hypothetical protein GCM10018777_56540 [Streptomyces viridodiastaticus]